MLCISHLFKTLKGAVEVVSSDLGIKIIVPDFAMGLTSRIARVQLGFDELEVSNSSPTPLHHNLQRNCLQKYIQEIIQERRKSNRDCSDLLSNLIAANENDSEHLRLTDQEIVGNVFIFLVGKCGKPCTTLI
jgi:cytochrome P450